MGYWQILNERAKKLDFIDMKLGGIAGLVFGVIIVKICQS